MRRLGYLLLAVVVFTGGVVAVLTATFDPNDHKERIVALVEEQTGRDLTITGDIGLVLFPRLAVAVDGLTLGQPPGFDGEPFARVGFASLDLALLPLLRGEVEAGGIRLGGVELNLVRSADGRNNWDDLTGTGDGEGPLLFAAEGLVIEDARLSWRDELAGEELTIDLSSLTTGPLRPVVGTPVGIALTFVRGESEVEVVLAAEVALDLPAGTVGLRDLAVAAVVRDGRLPEEGIALRLTGEVGADLDLTAVRGDRLVLDLPGARLRGEIDYAGGNGHRLTGRLDGEGIEPRRLLAALGVEVETADATAFASGDIALAVTAEDGLFRLTGIALRLDETRLAGEIVVAGRGSPAVRFDLDGDRLDLDRYLPPAAPGGEAVPVDISSLLLPPFLYDLNPEGSIGLGELIVRGVVFREIRIDVGGGERQPQGVEE